jgi:outer membrane protein with beta-barrel domain
MGPATVALALLLPGLAVAEPIAVAQATPPPAAAPAPAPAKEAAAAPAPAVPAVPPATASAPVAAAPAVAPTTAAPEAYGSYLVLKGGWFGTSSDFEGESFGGAGEWELAVGTGRVLGIELGVGSMTTSSGDLEVRTVPLLLTLRLGIPIAMVVPHVDLGAGLYFNRASLRDRDVDATTAGWQAGLGCDVLLGRLLLGADFRYMGISPTFSTIGDVTLDRYALLLKAGVRF